MESQGENSVLSAPWVSMLSRGGALITHYTQDVEIVLAHLDSVGWDGTSAIYFYEEV